MKTNEKLNLTMLCDFYELTMGNGYFVDGKADQICYFDVFFRNVPDGGGFAIAAGLEQVVEYIRDLHFSEDDLAYLRGRGIFDEGFLHYLENFHFTGDIYAVPEGTPVFPREPILTVRAPAIEAKTAVRSGAAVPRRRSPCRAGNGRMTKSAGAGSASGMPGTPQQRTSSPASSRACAAQRWRSSPPSRKQVLDMTAPPTLILCNFCGFGEKKLSIAVGLAIIIQYVEKVPSGFFRRTAFKIVK